MSWNELVGQPLAARVLRGAVAKGRVGHAYLFTGPDGVGKLEAGRLLAKSLNCAAPPEAGVSCDACVSCRKIDGWVHPDVILVEPAGRWIQIWQITQREESERRGIIPVRSFLALHPGAANRKVVILREAAQLNEAAANALLKSLEEPPEYGVMILTTANPAGVMPTIRSRCQPITFQPAPASAVTAALIAEGLAEADAVLAAAMAGGSLGRAKALSKDTELVRGRNETRAVLASLLHMRDLALFDQVDEWERQKDAVPHLLDLLLLWLRDGLVAAHLNYSDLTLGAADLEFTQTLAATYGITGLLRMFGHVLEARKALAANANVRLALTVMFLKLTAAAGQAKST